MNENFNLAEFLGQLEMILVNNLTLAAIWLAPNVSHFYILSQTGERSKDLKEEIIFTKS